jgi:hypothetical protein
MVITLSAKAGIGFSKSEADRLKGEIDARLQAANPGMGAQVTFPDFKMDNRQKRSVTWTVLSARGNEYDVEVVGMGDPQ